MLELIISFFAVPVIYLPEDYKHENGYICGQELWGYYDNDEKIVFICEWLWEREEHISYHEVWHYIFENYLSNEEKRQYEEDFKKLNIENKYDIKYEVFFREMFANSFSRVWRKKDTNIEYKQKLDKMTINILYKKIIDVWNTKKLAASNNRKKL